MVSLYDGTVAQLDKALNALTTILKKAEASPNAEKLLDARLHEDMLPLKFQLKMVTTIPQQVAARVNGTEVTQGVEPTSFADAFALTEKAKAALAKITPDTVNSNVEAKHSIGLGPGRNMELSLSQYLYGYASSNVFFHLVTAYDILRKEGVALGKSDYLGSFLY